MANPNVEKLVKLMGNDQRKVVEALVQAGFDTPRKIRGATDQELSAIPTVGGATVTHLREQWPKKGQ